MAISLNLQNLTEKAQEIYRLIENDSNYEKASQEAEELYQKGVELIAAEVQNNALIQESCSPVVKELNKAVNVEPIQDRFHLSLSKVYRIFVELVWYFDWRKGWGISESTEMRDSIIHLSQKIISILPTEQPPPTRRRVHKESI